MDYQYNPFLKVLLCCLTRLQLLFSMYFVRTEYLMMYIRVYTVYTVRTELPTVRAGVPSVRTHIYCTALIDQHQWPRSRSENIDDSRQTTKNFFVDRQQQCTTDERVRVRFPTNTHYSLDLDFVGTRTTETSTTNDYLRN